eukprot:TRINITY_DN8388_c0_g1_i1.p1 TRINITY_DN8388_c0_g1~~TRINITY_DN8388_c0_g1_i1.p1  ORF type:complete len:397 (+),score=42.34 TRINITY_DN8388_c0_g1_i1:109-1299(+)
MDLLKFQLALGDTVGRPPPLPDRETSPQVKKSPGRPATAAVKLKTARTPRQTEIIERNRRIVHEKQRGTRQLKAASRWQRTRNPRIVACVFYNTARGCANGDKCPLSHSEKPFVSPRWRKDIQGDQAVTRARAPQEFFALAKTAHEMIRMGTLDSLGLAAERAHQECAKTIPMMSEDRGEFWRKARLYKYSPQGLAQPDKAKINRNMLKKMTTVQSTPDNIRSLLTTATGMVVQSELSPDEEFIQKQLSEAVGILDEAVRKCASENPSRPLAMRAMAKLKRLGTQLHTVPTAEFKPVLADIQASMDGIRDELEAAQVLPMLHCLRATIRAACGEHELEMEDYVSAIQADPACVTALKGRAKMHYERNSLPEAFEDATAALMIDPTWNPPFHATPWL